MEEMSAPWRFYSQHLCINSLFVAIHCFRVYNRCRNLDSSCSSRTRSSLIGILTRTAFKSKDTFRPLTTTTTNNHFQRIRASWLFGLQLSLGLKNSWVSTERSIGTSSVFSGGIKMHSQITKVDLPAVSITTVPATEDNFMYLVIDKSTNEAVVVDPVDPDSMLEVIQKENVTLKAVLTTHHHWDHAGGNAKLLKLHGQPLEVYGGDSRVEAVSKKVQQGDSIKVGNMSFDCLHTPCHTSGHICYYLKPQDGGNPAVFTGDTLFIAGCGRFFEGTPQEMHEALIQKLGSLPDNTLVFCGHEYTVKNLQFALSIEANNEDAKAKLKWAQDMRSKQKPTVPSKLSEEKLFNPFMRCALAELQQTTGTSDAVSCMAKLRSSKDKF